MRIQCTRKKLLEACKVAARFTAKNDARPILEHLVLVTSGYYGTKGENPAVQSSDMESWCEIGFEGAGEGDYKLAILCQPLLRILSASKHEDARITTTRSGVSLSLTGEGIKPSSFVFPAIDCSAFPSGKIGNKCEWKFNCNVHDFVEGVKRTYFASADAVKNDDDQVNYQSSLTGISFENDAAGFYMVATDRNTVSCYLVPGSHPIKDKDGPIIVPASFLGKVADSLSGASDDEPLTVEVYSSHAVIHWNRHTFQACLLHGKFVPWKKLFHKRTLTHGSISAGSLASMVRQASAVLKDDVRMTVSIGDDQLSLSARSLADAKIVSDMKTDGPTSVFDLSSKYLNKLLRQLDGDQQIDWKYQDKNSPVMLVCGERHQYMIAPMVEVKR